MPNRGGLLFLALGGALGLPYLLSPSSGVRDKVASLWPAAESGSVEEHPHLLQEPHNGPISPAQSEIRGATITSPAQALNFEITPDWVMRTWPRVSTRLADLELQGYRVPLVTGTGTDAIAGSLTYYFNPKQQLQRITFVGSTGDPRQLVSVLSAQHYTLEKTDDPGLQLYRFKQWDKTVGECLIRMARVVSASSPRARFEITLDMRRPTRAI